MDNHSTMLALPDIRLATPADAPGIARMSRDNIEFGLTWSWTTARVTQAIRDASTNVAIAVPRQRLQAFGIMQYADNDAHLALLAVQPLMRHQGLGRGLLAWLEQSARTAGIRRIRLEARAENRHAITFYERQGYVRVGLVSGYYEGIVDAVKLRKILT
jgi:[ribosomal protein S18]-alanine N-acetyltransferase